MIGTGSPARPAVSGLLLRVRLNPRSSRDEIAGVTGTPDGPALAVRVRAIPSDGEANTALERLIAKWLDLPQSCVALTTGHKSRIKQLLITGNPGSIETALAKQLDRLPTLTRL